MKIVVGVDSFKGSLSSIEAGNIIKEAIHSKYKNIDVIVKGVSDGGEGFCDVLINQLNGKRIEVKIQNPLRQQIMSYYGLINDCAIIETAKCCGLTLVEEKNPLKASSIGLGQMIRHAVSLGVKKFIIGLGGSATNDGGMGMLEGLGYRFYDKDHQLLIGCGENLSKIEYIDTQNVIEGLNECHFQIASDVNTKLCGINGASYVFGPQKGASQSMIKLLDEGLYHFALVTLKNSNIDYQHTSGSGAAGGLGFAFLSYLNGQLVPGMELVCKLIHLDKELQSADYFITGEGKIDHQTMMGKAPYTLCKIAKQYGCKTIVIGGQIEHEAYTFQDDYIDSMFSIIDKITPLKEAMDKNYAKTNLKHIIIQIMGLIGGK